LKRTVTLIAILIVLAQSAGTQAMIFGIRYSDIREQRLPAPFDDGSRGRFGYYAGAAQGPSILLVGVDYDRLKTTRGDSLLYFRRLTANIGYRYQTMPADKGKAMSFMPFIALHYFKSFAVVKADSGMLAPVDVRYYRDMMNDSGFWLSGGAEYFLAPVFSLGGEAGIRYSSAKSKAYGYEIKRSQFTTFAAIIASFYW
jgi:hypothetical protein